MRHSSDYSTSWLDGIIIWSFILICISAGLAFSGLFFKVLFNCFMVGWNFV